MTPRLLTTAALAWLRYTQRCFIVTTERAPWYGFRPDAIGVKRVRGQHVCIEVEVKVTMQDFRANKSKRVMQYRENNIAMFYPWKHYFAVPEELKERAIVELAESASNSGLLVTEDRSTYYGIPVFECFRGAIPDPRATDVSTQKLGRLITMMSNALIEARAKL